MFRYYLSLAVRSLKRNVVLTTLMIAAIGVGIGASMTTLTVFRAMSGDPIPEKSSHLFAVQVDNWGPDKVGIAIGDAEHLQAQVSYTDAVNLMHAHTAPRESAMYSTGGVLTPDSPDMLPIQVPARAVFADFFAMFAVPFRYGSAWGSGDDRGHADVAVINPELNDKLFAGANSVGRTINLDGHVYRIVGVLSPWDPVPKFYDLNADKYSRSEQVFLPFNTAIDVHSEIRGSISCNAAEGGGWEGRIHSECIFIQYWAELPAAADVRHYRQFLDNYASEQRRAGRFHWPSHTRIRNVRDWLVYQHAVSDEVRILVLVSFSFLFVCLLNAMGLMLAKFVGRSADLSVRRALGAGRRAIFSQCLIESAVIGVAGGLVGLCLTFLGLVGLRSLFSEDVNRLTHLSFADVAISILLAIGATLVAGLYPTWRAAQVQPAWQLKTQ